ncbi:MAG: RNA-guided endonuclease TnpB family protein [Candidatus Thorarchaeota archaeon]|nr:RNA-guided endonuclease TnpB family protein [Candidatus Thorarchaeota archaeon]
MMINRAYRYELAPNNQQRTGLLRHAGTARFAYNWGLEQRNRLYRERHGNERFTSAIEQHREVNKLKKTEFPWMYDVSKCAPQEALRDLEQAFKNFFRRLKNGDEKVGFPKFKKKGIHDSFRLTGTIKFIGRTIQLPRLGRIRIKEKRECYHGGRILSATVSRRADRWFVSVAVVEEIEVPLNHGPAIGVDLGIKSLAVTSDGDTFPNPKALSSRLRKLRRLSRQLSRKKKGSKNRGKARLRLARLYLRTYNIRQDTLHKLTTHLVKNHNQIVIEDLNVSGMMKNHCIAKAISDVGFYEFRRQLEYKSSWYGSELILAPRFFPSSKRCSRCGHVKAELSLSERTYICEECGLVIDRDQNAANNLVAVSWTETENACGEDVRLDTNPPRFAKSSLDESGTEHH